MRTESDFVVVDSSVWVDSLRGTQTSQSHWLQERLSSEQICLTDLILCEVLQGLPNERVAREVLADFNRFPIFENGGVALASAAAKNYRVLRSKGFTVRTTIDCMIATFCLEEGYTLLHRDRDFDAFEKHLGLRVIHPAAVRIH